ncbi:unnamed protein product [Cylicocyclus nassatus]|uniref:SXP/RAL-2 family protein Ani s 5-like cation-binding domain-containing protein n=1 Tax=Cylicocyclus nassatus TaxID=53992 RepID=A0AA36GUZ9_CYLNA|nr:unnamed protein product [Cylicocyclus nassatus]
MQAIAVLAILAIVNIVAGEGVGVFPKNAVWEFLDLRKINNNMTLTLAERRQKKMEWAEKFGVKKQYTDYVQKRASMVDKTMAFLASLPKLYKQYCDTWDGAKLFKDIEAEQKKLAAMYEKEFAVMNLAKDLVEREEHKI